MGEDDIAEVSLLLDAATRADDHRPLGEHKWLDLVHGGRAGFAGFVARQRHGGPLVGYAQVEPRPRDLGRRDSGPSRAPLGGRPRGSRPAGSSSRRGRAPRWRPCPSLGAEAGSAIRLGQRFVRSRTRQGPLPDALPATGPGTSSVDCHPTVRARSRRGGLARGEQPGVRLASGAGRMGSGHRPRTRTRALVRSRRLPSLRNRRAAFGQLLDENPRGHRSSDGRDLRDLGRSVCARSGTR